MLDYTNLVPALNLCKHIPHGLFDKSLFVWEDRRGRIMDAPFNREPVVRRRRLEEDVDGADGVCPAPTYKEILENIENLSDVKIMDFANGKKLVTCKYSYAFGLSPFSVRELEISLVSYKAEDAMLRIWMSLLDRLDS